MLNVKQARSFRCVGPGVQGWETVPFHPRSVRGHPERRSARHRCVTLQVFLLALALERDHEAIRHRVSRIGFAGERAQSHPL
jgi:hypothetical protein